MDLYIFIVVFLTSFGRVSVAEISEPEHDKATCDTKREEFINNPPERFQYVKADSWVVVVKPCIALTTTPLPRCE